MFGYIFVHIWEENALFLLSEFNRETVKLNKYLSFLCCYLKKISLIYESQKILDNLL